MNPINGESRLNQANDHELMLALRNGDLNKLGILFRRYQVPLYNFFLRQGAHPNTGEDLVQEVFLRILKFRASYRGESKFTTWFFQIARNVFFDHHRKNGRTVSREDFDNLPTETLNPEELATQRDETAILRQALEDISPEKREAIILSRFHHLNYEEIAEITGTKLSTVKIRVFRGLKELTKSYQKLTGETHQ